MEHPSSSTVQQQAEAVILREVEKKLGIPAGELQSSRLSLNEAAIHLDGYSAKEKIICEVYARIGKLKPSQKHKVINDMMKMLLMDKVMQTTHRKLIAICDDETERSLSGKGWNALAIKEFGIEMIKVDIGEALKQRIIDAQKRQYR